MSILPLIPRSCNASSSRIPALPLNVPRLINQSSSTSYLQQRHIRNQRRSLSLIPPRTPASLPFFLPQFGLGGRQDVHLPEYNGKGKGKGRETGGNGQGKGLDPEEEVDDREWDIRVARAMLHLRETLPLFFNPEMDSADMFPPDIYSRHVVLKLPAPLPLKISSLSGYSMAFSLARNGMHALHTDLRTDLERLTFSPSPTDAAKHNPATALVLSRKAVPAHRMKQIRIQLAVFGSPRLPPHHEAKWHTSSLYTFSPYSGLITSHEVETIRPLPGEGVAEWLMSRLLGWTSRQSVNEGAVPCPRTIAVPSEHRSRLARYQKSTQGRVGRADD